MLMRWDTPVCLNSVQSCRSGDRQKKPALRQINLRWLVKTKKPALKYLFWHNGLTKETCAHSEKVVLRDRFRVVSLSHAKHCPG